MRWVYVLALAVAASAAQVLPTESGDVFYFAFGGAAGAVNVYGQVLWSVPGQLIASDAMGSCLAVANVLFNETAFLGTQISLYTADGRLLWTAVVRLNATALATDCVRVAVGGLDGSLVELKDGKAARAEKLDRPVFALAYRPDGSLAVGTGDPVGGFTAYVDRCGNSITAVKTDAPYLAVRTAGGEVRLRGGLAPMLRIPAAASQDCRTFVYAAYDTLYNGTAALARLPLPVLAVAASGDGRTVAAATAERLYLFRDGRLAAELELRSAPRSAALSWDGLSLAYATDAGTAVERFKIVRIEARGCPAPVTVAVGNFTYTPPAEAYVPAGAKEARPLPVERGAYRCVPVRDAAPLEAVVEYRVEYRVDAPPLVRGPQWASGAAAFYAEPEIKIPADPPLREVRLVLVDWEVNGTRRGFPQPSIVLAVRGPTSVRPVYRLEHPPEVVEGDVKYVVRSVVLFSRAGEAMADVADVPAYARVQYEVYRLLAWETPGNSSYAWLREGERALLRAPEFLDFGNGTRLVFAGWSTGERTPAVEVGPGRYAALYDVYHLMGFTATNYSKAEWVRRGARVEPPRAGKVYDDGSTRVYVAGWLGPDGREAQFPHVVTAPVNFTAVERREYYAVITMWDARETGWYPHGYELPEPDARKWLLWQFERWDPSPVVETPGEYVAIYKLDPLALSLVVLVFVSAVGFAWAYRRR